MIFSRSWRRSWIWSFSLTLLFLWTWFGNEFWRRRFFPLHSVISWRSRRWSWIGSLSFSLLFFFYSSFFVFFRLFGTRRWEGELRFCFFFIFQTKEILGLAKRDEIVLPFWRGPFHFFCKFRKRVFICLPNFVFCKSLFIFNIFLINSTLGCVPRTIIFNHSFAKISEEAFFPQSLVFILLILDCLVDIFQIFEIRYFEEIERLVRACCRDGCCVFWSFCPELSC